MLMHMRVDFLTGPLSTANKEAHREIPGKTDKAGAMHACCCIHLHGADQRAPLHARLPLQSALRSL